MNISPKAVALILEFEGMDQPARWPGGGSGITLGHGFDLGYATREQFEDAWSRYLKPEHVTLLAKALGKTGTAARSIASKFQGITLTKEEADEVFRRCTIPRWAALTAKAFPGMELLPEDAQGALVSLCFNRGTGMDGERRREMRTIRGYCEDLSGKDVEMRPCLLGIATQIRSMKRLWPLTSDVGRGLQRRREAEAKLVESCMV